MGPIGFLDNVLTLKKIRVTSDRPKGILCKVIRTLFSNSEWNSKYVTIVQGETAVEQSDIDVRTRITLSV